MEQLNEDRWSDPYELNRGLRKALRTYKGKAREKKDQDDSLADKYGLGAGVRLDLVRRKEDELEDSSRATWLSSSQKKAVSLNAEDSEEWQAAQIARRRLEQAERDKAALLTAETGWQERSLVNRSAPRLPSSGNPVRTVTKSVSTARAASGRASTGGSSSAVANLASKLRANSARRTDPFGGGPISTGFTSISSTMSARGK